MTLKSKLFAALLIAFALCTSSVVNAHGGGGVRVGIGLGVPGCWGGYCGGYPYYGYPYAYPYPYYAPAPVYYVPSPTVIQQPVYVQQPVAQQAQMQLQSPPQQYNYQPNNAPQQTFQSQPAAAAPANNNTTQQWVPGHWVTKPISAGASTQPAAASQQFDQNSPPPLPRPSVQ